MSTEKTALTFLFSRLACPPCRDTLDVMRRFLLTIQFDGTNYFGWQRQGSEQPSVQAVVEAAFADLAGAARPCKSEEAGNSSPLGRGWREAPGEGMTGQPVKGPDSVVAPKPPFPDPSPFPEREGGGWGTVSVIAASRTDRGVHARGMSAHVDLDIRLDADELRRAIDARLPTDIALIDAREVAPDFHCRHAAIGKCYAYRLHTSRVRSPLARTNSYFFPRALNIAAMRMAATVLVGTHDFSAFATLLSEHEDRLTTRLDPARPDKPQGNVRTLMDLRIVTQGDTVTVLVFGDGFLRGMVRGLAGTLVEVGLGTMTVDEVRRVLESRDRRQAGANLPACGLTLERVFYEQDELDGWREAARLAEEDVASAKMNGGLMTAVPGGIPAELLPWTVRRDETL